MAQPVTGVEKIEIAPIAANGAMPTTGWVIVEDIADGSVTFDVPALERTNIRVEDKAGVRYVLPADTEPPVFNVASIDIAGDVAALISGGTWVSGTKTFSAPTSEEIRYIAIRFTSKGFQGSKAVLSIPLAASNLGFSESITRTGFWQMTIQGAATTPTNASGEAVSPWSIQFVEDEEG